MSIVRSGMPAVVVLLAVIVSSMTASAEESFQSACLGAAGTNDGGEERGQKMCGCLVKGLEKGADADELLSVLRAPRGEKREPMMAAGKASRRTMSACMQRLRAGRERAS